MSTVTVHLMGGMANQMFQYAAGLALARRTGSGLVLDTRWQATAPIEREHGLRAFALPDQVRATGRRPWQVPKALRRLPGVSRMLGGAARHGLYVVTCREAVHHFDPEFFDLRPPCEIKGYFQSALYFEGVEAELRSRFEAIPMLSAPAAEWAARIRQTSQSIAVHVRGGDYLRQPKGAPLAPLNSSYYKQALRVMQGLLGQTAEVFVFTDDTRHAAQVLPAGMAVQMVETPADRPWEDMHLISLCAHAIIANSSFSWWGAWLNSREDKIVVAPRDWFTASSMRDKNSCDVYPAGWILV